MPKVCGQASCTTTTKVPSTSLWCLKYLLALEPPRGTFGENKGEKFKLDRWSFYLFAELNGYSNSAVILTLQEA